MTDAVLSLANVSAIQRWLMDVPRVDDSAQTFLHALAGGLQAGGLPLSRVSFALMTMHPEVLWRTVQWSEGDGIRVVDQPHARLKDPFFTKSPVAKLRAGAPPIRVRLEGAEPLPFPICDDLRAEGAADYYAQGLPFSNGQISHVSWTTRAAGGFHPDALAALDALVPFLARRLELESAYYGTRALLDVYLGHNAARRVLAGSFQRGRGELIDAAIWFSDMRGFTALSDRAPPELVIEVLDAYFDAVANAVSAGGGEVLKFIGDAVLAIFPVGGDGNAKDACRRALAAATESLAAVDRLRVGAGTEAEEPLGIGVALHLGAVMYGNIGARERLDFTVISSSVNEASRLESLCKQLGTPLALSEAFVNAAQAEEEIVDLGAHALKGVKAKLRVFTPRRLLRPELG